MKFEGWLLGADMSGDYLKIWIKKRDGQTVFAFHKYVPSFYAKPKRHFDMHQAQSLLTQHPLVKEVEVCKRYVSVSDIEISDVFRVWPDTPRHFKKIIRDIEEL